ncbi:hypothetical protein ACFL43_07135 [Thermodesulfobacteriota bacterium]
MVFDSFMIVCLAAYGLFLVGASRSFRDGGTRFSVLLLVISFLVFVNLSLVPVRGVSFLQELFNNGRNNYFYRKAAYCFIAVWIVFPLALIFWKKGKPKIFHSCIFASEICWFVAILLVLYGTYRYPG